MRYPVLSLVALLFAAPLSAQEPADEGRDSLPLIEASRITVRVLRDTFALQAIPYAIATVPKTQIQRARAGFSLDEALNSVPGVQVDNRFNFALGERISIRGFGGRAQFGVRGVKVFLDGVPLTLADGQSALNNVDLGSLGSVEVIRGPASSLYGNASGGVLLLETEEPPDARLGQEFRVVAGADGLRRYQSTTGGRTGSLGWLVNVDHLGYEGFRSHDAADNLHVNAVLRRRTGRSELAVTANVVDYTALNPGSLPDSLLTDRVSAFPGNVRQRTGETGRQAQVGAVWRRSLASGDLEVAGYGLGRVLDNPIPPRIIDLERTAGGARVAWLGRFPGRSRVARWTAGVDLDVQADDRKNFVNEEGERGALVLDQEETIVGTAGFAQLLFPIAGRVSLHAGLRHDRIRFEARDRLIEPADSDDSGVRTLAATSPSLGVVVRTGDALALYANAATAFETPTTTELANRPDGAGGFNPELEPQRVLSLELGARGNPIAGVTWEAAVYRARISDALLPFEVPQQPGRVFFRNAGSAIHRGMELGLRTALANGFSAHAVYTWIYAAFDEYATEEETFDGNRVPGIAPRRFAGTLAWQGRDGWHAAVDARYQSRMFVDDANTATSPGHWIADLRAGHAGLEAGGFALEPFVGITNLLDERYNASVTINAFGGRYYEPGPGRAAYAGIELRFGME